MLVKPSSARCNMACRYCFYEEIARQRESSHREFMEGATVESLVEKSLSILSFGDEIHYNFQGGEPTLIGLDFYRDFVERVEKRNISKARVFYSLQTNGILLDEEWAAFLRKKQFLVGLSMDGDRDIHDRQRPDKGGKGTFDRVLETKRLLEREGVEHNILTVLTRETAKNPAGIWQAVLDYNIRFIQFIPCIGERGEPSEDYSLAAEEFSEFYNGLFPLWKKRWDEGDYISVGFFDDIISYIGRGLISSCGINGFCGPQYVIESDGSIYPCDFYAFDRFVCGNIRTCSLAEAFHSRMMQSFLKKGPLSAYCGDCPFLRLCNGGCKRLGPHMYVNRAGSFCGLQSFLKKNAVGIDAVLEDLSRKG